MLWISRLLAWARMLWTFPWRRLFVTLRERIRDDRLGLTAGSLTFTTIIALVPFITVALAVFTAFPMFAKLQDVLQKWLIESLVPDNIARQVLSLLTMFASKASKLGSAGVAVLLVTALSLVLTIDRTLNSIWRVRRSRPIGQKIFIYWAALTLGPLLLAISLSITSYLLSASRGLVSAVPGGVGLLLDTVEFLVLGAGVAALYRYVPNTRVEWRHAWTGGLFVAAMMELAKKMLTLYLKAVPTYSMVYGAFATVPILLVWIYLAWLIVLLGAVMAAYLPSLQAGVFGHRHGAGWEFGLGIDIVQCLHGLRGSGRHGLEALELGRALQVDQPQLIPVLEVLAAIGWVGHFRAADQAQVPRWALLVEPAKTPLQPLLDRLLLAPGSDRGGLRRRLAELSLAEVLHVPMA